MKIITVPLLLFLCGCAPVQPRHDYATAQYGKCLHRIHKIKNELTPAQLFSLLCGCEDVRAITLIHEDVCRMVGKPEPSPFGGGGE